jgi:membrane protein implicated in regulation of membrane protease activity
VRKAILQSILAASAAVVAFMLAFAGLPLALKLRIITPGVWVSEVLYAPGSISAPMDVQLGVDFVFWFALMYALYWLVSRLWRKRETPDSPTDSYGALILRST